MATVTDPISSTDRARRLPTTPGNFRLRRQPPFSPSTHVYHGPIPSHVDTVEKPLHSRLLMLLSLSAPLYSSLLHPTYSSLHRSSTPWCRSPSSVTTRAWPPSHPTPSFSSEAVGPRAATLTRLLSTEKLSIAGHYPTPSGLADTAGSFHDLHCASPAWRNPSMSTCPHCRWSFSSTRVHHRKEPTPVSSFPPNCLPSVPRGPGFSCSTNSSPASEPPHVKGDWRSPALALMGRKAMGTGPINWAGFKHLCWSGPVQQWTFSFPFGLILNQFKLEFELPKFVETWIYSIEL
jgi:hypothetical protein